MLGRSHFCSGLGVLFLLASTAFASQGPDDSLSLEQFLARVRASHPVITQARILADQGLTQIREARGAMDPRASRIWVRP
jgi:hypothetical protein